MINRCQAEMLAILHARSDYTARRVSLIAKSGKDGYATLEHLSELGLIDRPAPHSPYVRLTPKGLNALITWQLAQDEAAKQQAQNKHQNKMQATLENKRRRQDARRSWVQWTITAILSIAALFAGAVPEMFAGFMQWISSLFH